MSDTRSGTREPKLFRDFGVRVLSAILLGATQIVALVWGGTMWWALVIAAIAVLATTEFYAITRTEHRKPNELFGLVAVAAMPLAAGWYLVNGPSEPVRFFAASTLGVLARYSFDYLLSRLYSLAGSRNARGAPWPPDGASRACTG